MKRNRVIGKKILPRLKNARGKNGQRMEERIGSIPFVKGKGGVF